MTARSYRDWIPLRVTVGTEISVDWCCHPEPRCAEPFFDQTLERCMKRPFNRLYRYRTPISELERWAAESPGIAPSGFIFHVSRCGSTLVSNLLGDLDRSLKLSEPSPLDFLARLRTRWPQIPEEQQIVWMRAMLSALAQQGAPEQRSLVVKLPAWNSADIPLYRRAFPETPAIFVYREPVEVLVSALRERPADFIPGTLPLDRLRLTFPQAVSMAPEEYVAHVLAHLYEAGIRFHDPKQMLLVNYRQLPDAIENAIAPFFDLDLEAAERSQLRAQTGIHAKHRRPFAEDSVQKQASAAEAIRSVAQQRLQPLYAELEMLRSSSS